MNKFKLLFYFQTIFLVGLLYTGCDSDEESKYEKLTGDEVIPEINWINIPKGRFLFGSPENTTCRMASTETFTSVVLTHSFLMAETEITQKQWTAMDLNNPSQYQGNNIPVTFISFYDAALWCNKLSKLEGLDTCYNLGECKNVPATGCDTEKELEQFGCGENTFTCGGAIRKYSNMYLCPGYRLPTTVEWEYAAKADFAEARTYGGNLLEENLAECFEQPSLNDIAWYCYNSEDHPHPVAQKKPNPWGLYDTLGNTFEWIDYFDHGRELNWYEEKEPLIDPTGTPTGIVRDLRGGSYYSVGCLNNPTFQNSDDSYARGCDYGFRPVRTLFE